MNSEQSIEQARQSLDLKLANIGYEHPEQAIPKGDKLYKVYSEKNDDVYLSQNYDTYATFNTHDKPQDIQKPDICPICNTKALYACGCPIGEMMCISNHMWYVENDGTLKIGDPHSS